jgi:hypothetical protein
MRAFACNIREEAVNRRGHVRLDDRVAVCANGVAGVVGVCGVGCEAFPEETVGGLRPIVGSTKPRWGMGLAYLYSQGSRCAATLGCLIASPSGYWGRGDSLRSSNDGVALGWVNRSPFGANLAMPRNVGSLIAARNGAFLCVFIVLLLVSGCGQHNEKPASEADQKTKAARSEVERGPVRLLVSVEPSAARLSDEPKLTIEIEYPQGIAIRKPEFGSALGEFVIRDFREPMPRVHDDRQIVQKIYTLEPMRTGKIVIDPIALTFTDDRPGGSGKEHTLETEPLTVEVAAAVAEEAPSLDQLHPSAGLLPLPQSLAATYWWIVALAGVAVAATVGLWRSRRRRREESGTPLTPVELAYLELQRLLENQHAREDVKLFYVELTAIVRRYIERTKGIHAPEQTTQEFLHEIGRRSDYPADESRRLMSFLEAADLVKFAAHQPRAEDIEESFRRAKVFVGCAGSEKGAGSEECAATEEVAP